MKKYKIDPELIVTLLTLGWVIMYFVLKLLLIGVIIASIIYIVFFKI